MTTTTASVAERWPVLLGRVAVAVLVGTTTFFWLSDREPQDVLIHGLGFDRTEEMFAFTVDGNQVGSGPFVCVPKMQQGERTIEIRSATETVTFTASIGDVGARILKPQHLRGYEYVELSNCQDEDLVRRQTTFPYVSPAASSPVNGSVEPAAR